MYISCGLAERTQKNVTNIHNTVNLLIFNQNRKWFPLMI